MRRLLVCAGGNEQFERASPVGIGMVAAAIGVARLLAEISEAVSEVIFVGSCGLYINSEQKNQNGLNLLDVFECKIAANIEATAVLKMGYSPADILASGGDENGDICIASGNGNSNIAAILKDKKLNVSHETIAINSSNFITLNEVVATELADLGFAGENMELFGVFRAARAFGVPARAILCATNFCGENAHEEFVANHYEAKRRLGERICELGLVR